MRMGTRAHDIRVAEAPGRKEGGNNGGKAADTACSRGQEFSLKWQELKMARACGKKASVPLPHCKSSSNSPSNRRKEEGSCVVCFPSLVSVFGRFPSQCSCIGYDPHACLS